MAFHESRLLMLARTAWIGSVRKNGWQGCGARKPPGQSRGFVGEILVLRVHVSVPSDLPVPANGYPVVA